MRWQTIILLIVTWGGASSCSSNGTTGQKSVRTGSSFSDAAGVVPEGVNQDASGSAGAESCAGLRLTDAAPEAKNGNSAIVFKLSQAEVDPCSVSGYIVGQPDDSKLVSAGNGIYYVPDVAPGTYDVIVEARQRPGATATEAAKAPEDVSGANLTGLALTEPARVGIRVNSIAATAAAVATIPASETLQPVGWIRGVVTLEGAADQSGTKIAVQGTKYTGVSGEDGKFLIEGVVPGKHEMLISHGVYQPASMTGVAVVTAAETMLPSTVLKTSSGDLPSP